VRLQFNSNALDQRSSAPREFVRFQPALSAGSPPGYVGSGRVIRSSSAVQRTSFSAEGGSIVPHTHYGANSYRRRWRLITDPLGSPWKKRVVQMANHWFSPPGQMLKLVIKRGT
jgi:hypothetical protein